MRKAKSQHFWPKKIHRNAHTFLIHGLDQHGGDVRILHQVEKQSDKEATKHKHEEDKTNFHLNLSWSSGASDIQKFTFQSCSMRAVEISGSFAIVTPAGLHLRRCFFGGCITVRKCAQLCTTVRKKSSCKWLWTLH